MAKLLSYYRLCPLIDTKSLLGISEDSEKGVVIVTLGRNIAIKYRLSDQKQICSWRSKEKFSSPVLYDRKLEKYVAVFNQTFIRVWTEDEETLDKVKKYKFDTPIYTILTHNQQTFVVFQTGSVYPLNEILESRKTFTPALIIEDSEIYDIVYASLDEDLYFGILVKNVEGFLFHWTVYTYYSKNVFLRVKLFNHNVNLKGYVLFGHNKRVSLLTVWNDGKIYAKEMVRRDKEEVDLGELFTVLENISTEHFVKVVPLDDKYIAIYGSDPNEEGAVLLIYSTQFKVTQSKQIHKLYTEDAKIWKTYNFILLPVGQNLIVVPFCLDSEQLAALIGSHRSILTKLDADIAIVTDFQIADWNDGKNVEKNVYKNNNKLKKGKKREKKQLSNLKNKVEELFKEGLPEALIVEQIIPDILEQSNLLLLDESLDFFTDIPEKFLVKILQFILLCDKKKFEKAVYQGHESIPEELLPTGRVAILDKVLSRSFSDRLILPYLRSELSVYHAFLLLQYLIYQLSEDGHNLPSFDSVNTEKFIVNWISLVIDSNYQKFVISKDSKIENTLVKCQNTILEYLEDLEDLKTVVPVLARFEAEAQRKNCINGKLANSLYSIEQIDY